jgi:hypothetical protein
VTVTVVSRDCDHCNLPERYYTTEIRDIFLNRQRLADCTSAGDPDLDAGRASKNFEFVDSVDKS